MKFTVGTQRLLTEHGWIYNRVLEIENGFITRIAEGKTADYFADILTTGLFDPHIHGGDGFDSCSATVEDMQKWLVSLQKHGVSAVLVTLSAAPFDNIRASLAVAAEVMRLQKEESAGGARVLGVHLEGPFISPYKVGAMDAKSVLPFSEKLCNELIKNYASIIRIMTLAVEETGAEQVLKALKKAGIYAQVGHSIASFEQGEAAFALGVDSVCHFFNAAIPIHHRQPGFLTAALLNEQVYCEVIADFVHVHPEVLRLLYKIKTAKRIILISDAIPSTNLPDGNYMLRGRKVCVKNGVSRTESGVLNGGAVYLPGAVKNMVSIGVPTEEAVFMAASTAAHRLNMRLPSVQIGECAFLLGWNTELHPIFNIIGEKTEKCI